MIDLFRRAAFKIKLHWFALRRRSGFARLGEKSFLFSPYRLDGAKRIEIGAGSSMQSGGWLYCVPLNGEPARLTIGKGCILGYNNHITAVSSVTIGDHVLTANNVYIADNLHEYEDIGRPILQQPVKLKRPVSIGEGSWIGENVCIIGANIGRNCVIGANAVVTRDVPDYCVAFGIPATVIRRFDSTTRRWIDV